MKALSVRQPFVELILKKRKTVETRTWNTKFRGVFLIHASKTIDKKACNRFNIDPKTLVTGAIVGKACLVSTKEYTKDSWDKDKPNTQAYSDYTKPRFGFVLKNVERVAPKPCKGKLGFFNT